MLEAEKTVTWDLTCHSMDHGIHREITWVQKS